MTEFLSGFRLRIVLAVLAVILIVSGFSTWKMLDIPFGPTFDTAIHLACGSLILLLLLPGLSGLRRRSWWLRAGGGLMILFAVAVTTLPVVLHVDYTVLPFIDVRKGLTSQEWHEDLAYLAQEMPRMHPNLFSMIPEEDFRREVAILDSQIDTLSEVATKAGLARIVALPNDGHTFPNIFSLNLDWHVYPMAIHFFGEQLVIVDAGREHRDLVGSRIIRIDDTPLTSALEKMEHFLSFETPSMRSERLCNSLGVAEWLYAAGVTSRQDRAEFTVIDRAGAQSTITMDAVHYLPCIYWMMARKVDNANTSIAVKGERRSNYRFEFLEDSRTLYFQFSLVSEDGQDETLADFTARLEDYVATHDFDRFVVDVRNNDGGNGLLLPPLVSFLARSEKINREERLFVLTSGRSYSAAAMFTVMMQNNTHAITVGATTAQGVHFFSGPEILKLPNSGMEFLVSSRLTSAGLSCDRRDCVEPDLPVEFTLEDHFAGRDPCLQAAISHVPRPQPLSPVAPAVATRICGRYRFGPMQVLEIAEAAGRLRLEVTDFLDLSTRYVNTGLGQLTSTRLQTDIPGVEVHFAPGAGEVQNISLDWRGENVIAPRMRNEEQLPLELIQAGKFGEGVRGLLENKDLYVERVPNLENMLNTMGYEHLRESHPETAVEIFRLNSELFPESSNVYDSLGEACLANGERERAISNYRRSLELNPENENATSVLADLGASGS